MTLAFPTILAGAVAVQKPSRVAAVCISAETCSEQVGVSGTHAFKEFRVTVSEDIHTTPLVSSHLGDVGGIEGAEVLLESWQEGRVIPDGTTLNTTSTKLAVVGDGEHSFIGRKLGVGQEVAYGRASTGARSDGRSDVHVQRGKVITVPLTVEIVQSVSDQVDASVAHARSHGEWWRERPLPGSIVEEIGVGNHDRDTILRIIAASIMRR